jgi:hypothetical protein
MSQIPAWVVLTRRYGGDFRQPSDKQLAQAVDELFTEDLPGMKESDYLEHPNAWLKYGFDDGPLFVADASRSKTVSLSKYADQDDDDPLTEVTFEVDRNSLLMLWVWLAMGEIMRIREAYPSCGW